ncbi:MAG: S9 family peptidase [Planctomycetes bacterium]|nr:S9 family peptidase [Planctomycetota bacterium]
MVSPRTRRMVALGGILLLSALCAPLSAGRSRNRPYAYLFSAELHPLTERLQRVGVQVDELREDIELEVEIYEVTQPPAAGSPQPGTKTSKETRRFETGTILVKTKQELGRRIVRLLDPGTNKGPRVRRLLPQLRQGDQYPIVRLASYVPITLGQVRPLPEKRKSDQPITFETVYGPKHKVDFGGSPVSGLSWLQDGEHYLQVRDGKLYQVHAVSGRSTLFLDPNKLAEGLMRLPTVTKKEAQSLSKRTSFQMSPDHTAVLLDYENDLYYATIDGTTAVRLTSSPGREKYATFDPQGRFVAFVRDSNLYVVDVVTRTERALTTDGGGTVRNGEADWVYFEEVFSRQWKVFWWSPDSSAIAFYRTDNAPVPKFTVVNNVPQQQQQVETTAYPRAGESNPEVKLGIVSVAGGPVKWVDLNAYSKGAFLITGAGWLPDNEKMYFFVQDRAQTWLDINTASKDGGAPKRLLRETTKAWVEPPDTLEFLADGSFLLSSERTGWKHLYLYDKDAKLKHAVTSGDWEARKVHHVDEKDGWVYLTGTRDSPIAENLYRAKLDGSAIARLTKAAGQHQVSMSPTGGYYIDRWSDASTPAQVALYASDGTKTRMLDTNPVYEREEYRFGAYEQFQIRMADGFQIEASLLKPPDFDSNKKHPVWFMTYAGPHSPTISAAWQNGRAHDQMLAQMGMLVFRCDPRTASGKGTCSAWPAYKQLGVQELKDIEEAIQWLKQQPYVDGARIGMSGHSYGGFMTAYALTHSEQFAGGIAGAPPTDWHLYDTIYTERYMDTPQNNPEGYERTSVINAAKNLHGQLLLIHGDIDDNVHVENTFKFINALQEADKKFQLMIYPKSRHGIGGIHYQRLMVDFIRTVLQLPDLGEGGGT